MTSVKDTATISMVYLKFLKTGLITNLLGCDIIGLQLKNEPGKIMKAPSVRWRDLK